MNSKTQIGLGIASAALIGVGAYFAFIKTSNTVKSTSQALQSGHVGDVLWKVIAREGASKNYTDVISLDGGTVGIAHFAYSGLGELYQQMNTEKYFGKSKQEMISKYSKGCRPSGRSGNDTGWGCYSQPWWREGMERFVNSSESKKVQDRAWYAKMKPVIENALSHGWNTKRQIAIALGIANSKGASGFNSLASKNSWDPEKTLQAYNTSDHYQRRVDAINKNFPV